MKILGIDTTTKSASCSILSDNKYYTKSVSNEITHSEKLLPIIDETLKEANLNLDNIDMFATINGPGSFTGIRIGLATIKAFSQVKEIDIFSISSIDLISYVAFKNSNIDEAYVLSLIDAKNNRFYYGINKLSKDANNKISIEKIIDVNNDIFEDVLDVISQKNILSKDLIISGNFTDDYLDKLSSISNKCIQLYPSTQDLIDCYLNISNNEEYMYNAYSLDALYARPSQAERMSNNG